MRDKLPGMLGLARRAGKVLCGVELIRQAVRSRRAAVVLLARDASANTVKRLSDTCRFYQVPCMPCGLDRERLGSAVGTGPAAGVAVCDAAFAKTILDIIRSSDREGYDAFRDEV